MARRLFLVAFSFLLLGLQQEAFRHGFDHLRQQLAQAHQRALQLPAEPCDECALLAGAAHAATGHPTAQVTASPGDVAVMASTHAHTPRILSAYAARAPPLSA